MAEIAGRLGARVELTETRVKLDAQGQERRTEVFELSCACGRTRHTAHDVLTIVDAALAKLKAAKNDEEVWLYSTNVVGLGCKCMLSDEQRRARDAHEARGVFPRARQREGGEL